MDTIDNLIVALTANIEFKNAIKQLKEFQKKNGDYKLNVNTDDLEKSYENFIKFANKKSVQAFNFSKDTASIIKMSGYEPSGNKAEDNKFYDALFSDLEKTNARMERADKFVKDMVKALGKSEEQVLGMISRMSSTDINKLVGNKYSEYDTWSNKRDRAKFKRGYNYSEKAEERADRVAIARGKQEKDTTITPYKNAYIGVDKDYTEDEKKSINRYNGKTENAELEKTLTKYLELEAILKRVEEQKNKLSQQDEKDETTLKQILQLTSDASRLRMLMADKVTASNGAMQKFAESNKDLKLVNPETETWENRNEKVQEAKNSLIHFYQQELEREAQDATDSIIKMFKEAFEKAKASISESADTFGSLGNIDKSVRKYIQNINTAKDAEGKLLEVSEKLKGSKGIVSSENIEYAKDAIGYLSRYIAFGEDVEKLYAKLPDTINKLFQNFSDGQIAPEFLKQLNSVYDEVQKAKDLKIGFGVGSGEGVGNVGQVNDELERQTQIVEKLGEEYKNVAKYAVGAEEALAKVEELAKRSNSKKGIDDLERKDMIGYAARFNAINTDDNLTFSEVAQKAIEENQKKYYATADKVAEMSKKLSSSASGTENGVGGITPEQLKTLTGYLQQIIDKLKEIKDLSNNKTPLFNEGDIKTFTQGMQEAIDKLDFSKVSESIEKINFKAVSEEAEKAIITIAEKFETLGEQIAQSIANGINNGAKEVKVEDTVVPKKEEIKEEKPKTETKPERKAITVEDLDKEIERYSELKTKIDECDVELEKIKSKRKEPTISPEDIEGIETYLHKLAQVNDSKSSMYDTSSDDNFNFISKDNSDELSKLEISLDNLIQKCEPLKNFTFDFEQFASAEEASAALTTALEQELSVLKQEDPELERQITALSNSRTIMSSQLSNSVSSITNMKKELGVDTTVLDLDEAVNKLNTLDREIVDCEEKIRSLKETEKVNLVSDQDIQQMKQLNEVFRGIKYNPRSFDVTESWQEFDTMLSKSNINEEIKTKLSNTAREIAQTSSMTGNPVSIQKQILDMLQREITEQESLVSANKDKVTVENEEVVVTQNRLTQLQQEKSELQETVNLIKEKLQLQSAATSQPSNQIPVSSGNTASSNPSISDELKIENEQLGENVSKYQEIVSLVQEYYGLIQKLQKPTIEFQKYNEEYARVDQYLRNQMAGKPIDPSDPDTRRKIIHNRYKGFTKGINNGDDFALKAIKSAIYDYWGNATEMPNDEDLLSSTSITEGRGKNSRYTTVIPKKYKELEKSVIQEAIAMNENNKAYKEEREQIEANNSAIKERLNLIRQNIKGIGISPEYKGDYRMGLTLKPSEASKTDIFNMTSSMSQEEMIKEICNMLGIEIPKNAEKAETEIDTFNQKLQESKKYVNEIRQGFMNIVGNVSKKETLEKFPELAEFKNRRSIDEARNFLDTDEWNDFLSTLPQAHTYLESIGYDFERIYKLSDEEIKWFKGLSPEALLGKSWLTDKNGNPLKENYQEIRRAFKATQTDTSSPAIESQNKLQEELKETQEQATRTKQVVESVQSTGNKNGILSDSTTSSSPSKLGVTKNAPIVETDNSQEITREQQALTSLGEYIGQVIKLVNEKTAAFEKEQQVVDGSVQREITALTELSGWLVSVKEDVDKITTAIANLPSIDIKADLSGLDSDKITEDVVKKFAELSKALNNTDTSNISAEGISALNGLDVSKTAGDNLQKVANAITNIKVSLNNLGDGGKSFIEDIKEIVNAGEALKNFNEILKKTKTERKEAAKQATGQSEDKPKTKTQQSNELYGAISVKQKENIKQMRNLLSNTPGVAEEAQRIIDANNVEIKQLEEKIKQQNLFNEKKEAELQVNRDNIAIQELNIQDKKAQNSDKESWIAVNSIKLKDVNLNEVEKLGDDWKIALQQTAEYKDVLGECYDITKQIRRDSKGNYLESYRLTGEKGSVVLGRDGTYLHSNMKVSSAYSDKKQSEKDAEIYNANTSKREENQRKAEVESASNIQKSVWESILQIRTQISDLELKDDQLNDNKIESLKQEESLLQSIYNDQTRILKAKATQKELESQNTALSKLGIKGKNAEEKVIENAIVNKAKEEKMLNDAYAMNADYDKKKAASSTKDNRKEIIAQYNKLISLEKELTTLRTRQQAGIGSQYDIDKTEQEIARRKEIIENLKQTTSYTQKETDAQTEYNNKVKELQELFNTNSKALGNSQVTDFINRLGNINVLGLEQNIQDTYTQIGKLTDKFSEGKITVTDYQKQVGNLVIALENVKKVIEPNNINLGKSELEQYFAENGAQVKKVSTSKDGKTLTVDATKYDGVNKSLKELVGTYDLVTGRVSVFERKTSSAMTNLQKSLAAFKGKLQAVFRYLTTFVGVYEIIGAIKSGISTVIEFDTALSEMRKVSSASTATLKELQKESFNVADEVGSTALQIQKSTADFLRLGKSQQKLWLAPLYRNV